MSTRVASLLASSVGALSLTLLVATAAVSYASRRTALTPQEVPLWLEVLFVVAFAAYPTVGAFLASRRPENLVGWLLCLAGLAISAGFFTQTYAPYARAASLPGAGAAALLTDVNPGVGLAIFVVLLFPDGRLPSRRWRPVVWLVAAQILVSAAQEMLAARHASSPVAEALVPVNRVLLYALIAGTVASVALRLRRARGEERQQIKWFVYAASLIGVSGVASISAPEAWGDFLWLVTLAGFAALPVAVGVAILRYRLYDIDLLINRTLVYGTLTAMLVAVYFGAVVLLERLFVAATGQGSPIAIVASTLFIAALFNPLRRRVQAFVDRRFYRRKYDARRTLEAFSARLRDETDLEALGGHLVEAVGEAMQPAHASLWLLPVARSKDEDGGAGEG